MDLSKFESYGSGFDMWRDAAIGYGMIPARIMCNQYLKMQEKQCATDPVEAQFCQELRDGMAAGLKFDNIPVYRHDARLAELRGELDLYNKSIDINSRCAEDIDVAIHAVEYGDGTHDFDRALVALTEQYGVERVRCVLAAEANWHGIMGNVSKDTCDWAQSFKLHEDFHSDYHLRTHPEIFEGLITELRKEEAKIEMKMGMEMEMSESDGSTQWYTLDEIIKMNEPQNQRDKALISDCIDGLGVYAALKIQDNSFTSAVEQMRNLIDRMVPYWGLDYGEDAKSVDDFLQAYDEKIDAAKYGIEITDDPQKTCAMIVRGLHRYGLELSVAQGNDAMGEILQISDLIKEVAQYFDFDSHITDNMAAELVGEVKTMLAEYDLPGTAIEEGENIHNYVVERAVLYDNDRGFAFAHNPEAASPYVTWQFTNEDGKPDYYWGKYYGSEEAALVNYIERTSDYAQQHKVTEKPIPIPVSAPAPVPVSVPIGAVSEAAPPEAVSEPPVIKPLIQFIDSEYRELFKIPDGESIRITYPPDDGREPVERSCKFEGTHHINIEKNGVYHICEFAERMERIGARYEPVNQLRDFKITPSTADKNEEKFYKHNREEGNTCVGSLHGDFGNSGERYHASWNERQNNLYTPEIQSELQSVVYALRQDLLKDRDSMLAYCQNHPEAKRDEGKSSGNESFAIYGFKSETESRQYFINCFAMDRDSRFSIFAYADKPVPALEQSPQQTAGNQDNRTNDSQDNRSIKSTVSDTVGKTNRSVPNVTEDKPSVMEQIREARSAPKPPTKPKQEQELDKNDSKTVGKKKSQPEL